MSGFDQLAEVRRLAVGAFGSEEIGWAVAGADVAGVFYIGEQGDGVEAQAADVIEFFYELLEGADAIEADRIHADGLVVVEP